MPLAPFAALEARANRAVFARLANAEVSIDGAAPVGGIFEQDYQQANVGTLGMASSQPAVLVPSGAVPANPVGKAITVRGVAYAIAAAEPDGVGGTVLVLELDLEAAAP